MAASLLRRTALDVLKSAVRIQRPCSGSGSAVMSQYPGIIESHDEYCFVERLIPRLQVPDPPKHTGVTPSGWIPPKDTPPDLPYFVRRSRMHNIPVYKDITHGNRQMTVIRKIEGDIWALETEVKDFLTQLTGKTPATQVNEINRTIRVKGYFDTELQTWLGEKGF
ncbi:PREDICTED: 39S ribosomal protein L49, mitochondrial [Nanorana parkeri]|uniref:39S ribosomal protein L49, mitochondrial n=1 Tax=Nanorana parkeri TaxID=125878 RepID=UPI000854ADB4|nr:PREDICTED: 39S ribosomal protein L49, mitochondrial [Nanorana parkeri]